MSSVFGAGRANKFLKPETSSSALASSRLRTYLTGRLSKHRHDQLFYLPLPPSIDCPSRRSKDSVVSITVVALKDEPIDCCHKHTYKHVDSHVYTNRQLIQFPARRRLLSCLVYIYRMCTLLYLSITHTHTQNSLLLFRAHNSHRLLFSMSTSANSSVCSYMIEIEKGR